MNRTLVTIGWLMFASASFGSDGQHTGVGGNPFVPPPNPQGVVVQPWKVQMIVTPGLLIVQPEFNLQDASLPKEASRKEDQDQDNKAGEPLAQ
ncbi:MAG TPA: hypothetical protein VE954_04630 [Oligoflexus sp.]|uniref:hypothetical protein n=1 Tax=Oligoflexus sp. TaxID=1971216 RepID=UPI002D3CDD16|nr:hypothetical protein [Oligoflexus sp.]HYX32376.1 hypothetical protein [Oligoflexus sp.]